MKASTEATKLNFITDQGSSRERVSIAWRLFARRPDRTDAPRLTLPALRSERFCQKPETEPASPAAAQVIPAPGDGADEEEPESDRRVWGRAPGPGARCLSRRSRNPRAGSGSPRRRRWEC